MKNFPWRGPALLAALAISSAILGAACGAPFVTPGDTSTGGGGTGASTGGGGASTTSTTVTGTGASTTSSTGTGTGDEDCFNGHDDNSDGLADCDDPLCQSAGVVQCTPPPPDDTWIGPGIVTFGLAGQTLGCMDGKWGVDELYTSGDLDVPALDCECSCDPTPLCTPASMLEYPGGCALPPVANIFKPDVACTNDPNPLDVKSAVATSAQNLGGCKPMLKRMDTPITFKEEARFCREPIPSPCGDGKACVASPEGDQHLCIMKLGDAACPAATYTQKFVTHDGFTDGRTCSSCTCGQPVGITCGGVVELFDATDCMNAPFDTLVVNTPCKDLSGTLIASYRYVPDIDGGCQPSSSSSQGSAIATDTRTFCCAQ
jgi:hypothetical protein